MMWTLFVQIKRGKNGFGFRHCGISEMLLICVAEYASGRGEAKFTLLTQKPTMLHSRQEKKHLRKVC